MKQIGKIEPIQVESHKVANANQTRPKKPARAPSNPALVKGANREFLPAALEILETPANPAGRAMAILIVAMFCIAIGWAVIGKVDVVAIAPGQISPVGGNKLIQPLEIGTIRAIHVSDGQRVEAGQILVELDPTEDDVDLDQLRQQQIEHGLEASRLRAFISALLGDGVRFSADRVGASELLVRIHETQLRSDLAAFEAEAASIAAERSRLVSAKNSAAAELEKSLQTLPIIRDREASTRELFDKGLRTRPDLQQIEAAVITAVHDLEIHKNRVAEVESELVAIEKQHAFLVASHLRQAYASLTEAETMLSQLELATHRAETRKDRHVLRSPVSGTVQQMQVHTIGGVVQPATPIMLIVPSEAPLEIRANLLNKDMGRIFEGQDVEVKLDAFDFTEFGTVQGKLMSISQDAIQQDGAGLVYEGRVQIDMEGSQIALTPGMSVTVEIKIGTRRIIDFILSPLKRYQDEALREV